MHESVVMRSRSSDAASQDSLAQLAEKNLFSLMLSISANLQPKQ